MLVAGAIADGLAAHAADAGPADSRRPVGLDVESEVGRLLPAPREWSRWAGLIQAWAFLRQHALADEPKYERYRFSR